MLMLSPESFRGPVSTKRTKKSRLIKSYSLTFFSSQKSKQKVPGFSSFPWSLHSVPLKFRNSFRLSAELKHPKFSHFTSFALLRKSWKAYPIEQIYKLNTNSCKRLLSMVGCVDIFVMWPASFHLCKKTRLNFHRSDQRMKRSEIVILSEVEVGSDHEWKWGRSFWGEGMQPWSFGFVFDQVKRKGQ